MKMVCFVSSRTFRRKHIVTCFFLPKGKPLLRDGQNKHFHVQLWANTAFEGSQFTSIGVPKFYSWVNVISVYVHNDLG